MIGHAPKQKKKPAMTPHPKSDEERLEEGLEESFPASDPPSSVQPHRAVWNQDPETD